MSDDRGPPHRGAEGVTGATSYRFAAIESHEAARLRSLLRDDEGYNVRQFRSDDIVPCRHCLEERSAEQGMLLLSYRPSRPAGIYGHATAIFLCAQPCRRFCGTAVPQILLGRMLALRAFQADGTMLYDRNDLILDGPVAPALGRAFRDPQVAYVNLHTAKAGCFLCHVERT